MADKKRLIDTSVFGLGEELDRKTDELTGRDLSFWEVVPRIAREHLWPMWPYLVLSYLAGLLVSATTGAIPFLIQITSDKIVVERDLASLNVIPLAVVAVMALKSLGEYTAAIAQFYIAGRMDIDIKRRTYQQLLNADLAWLQRIQSGKIVASVTTDATKVATSTSVTIVTLGKSVLTVIVLVATMLYMDALLTVTALIGLPFVLIFFRKQRKLIRQRSKRQMQETGDMVGLFVQALRGVREVKAYGREQTEVARMDNLIRRGFEFSLQVLRTQAASGPITQLLAGIGIAAAIWYGGYRGITGTMTPGEFMGFITAAMLLYPPLKQVAALQTAVFGGIAAASRVFPIMDNVPVVRDRPGAQPLQPSNGALTFENVRFSYEQNNAKAPALNGVSFDIEPGQNVAFVGASGAGKSTVMNIIMRFYEPDGGRVLIDGQDISEATLSSVRGASALVSQEPFLFDDTVRTNITYGVDDATDADVEEAARTASAHEFIAELPKGYETLIGEGGSRLSGGQKQRLAIARAILSKAPILLLDEPTSALDSRTEQAIEEFIHGTLNERTVVMIAHRLSTVRRADRIFVMEAGKIVESGNHQALMAKDGAYAALHRLQSDDTSETKEDTAKIAS